MIRRVAYGAGLVVVGIVLLVLGTWAQGFLAGLPGNLMPDAPPEPTVDPADLAPDFDLPTLSGGRVKLSALRGQPVIVNFWASWCAPCLEELPMLAKFAESRRQEAAFLAVNVRENPDVAWLFADRAGVRAADVLLSDTAIMLDYQVVALPMTLVVDRRGVLTCRHNGIITEAKLLACLGQ